MEITLFCITSINNTMLELLLESASKCNAFVVTSRPQVKQLVEQHGIHCYLLQEMPVDVSVRDIGFASEFMPGYFEDTKFKDTDLEIWKVLSLDRLKFWYSHTSHKIADFIMRLQWDKAYVSLDLGETLPWIVANEATKRDAECIAVQTESIRTKEILDMSKYFNFTEYIVTDKEDKKFLNRLCPDAKVTVREEGGEKPVEFPERASVRKGLGMSEGEVVYGLFFDKRDEWQCRKWLSENVGKVDIIVVPTDERSSQLLPDVLNQYMPYIHVYSDPAILDICESVVSFRYDLSYMRPFKDKILILDYLDLNKTKELVDGK